MNAEKRDAYRDSLEYSPPAREDARPPDVGRWMFDVGRSFPFPRRSAPYQSGDFIAALQNGVTHEYGVR